MWKARINKISLVLNVVLAVWLFFSIKADKSPDYSNLNRQEITKIVDRYIDTSGNEHVVNTPVLVRSNELKDIKHTETYKLIDSLSNELKIANKKINTISSINIAGKSTTKGTLVDTVYTYKDSIINWVFNPYLSTLDFNANLKLNSVTYTDRKSFLGIPYGESTVYNNIWINDPQRRFKINGMDNIIIKNTVPDNGVKISSIFEYRVGTNDLLIGPEIEFNYNRTSGYVNYLYSPQYSKWEPTFGIKYYFLK